MVLSPLWQSSLAQKQKRQHRSNVLNCQWSGSNTSDNLVINIKKETNVMQHSFSASKNLKWNENETEFWMKGSSPNPFYLHLSIPSVRLCWQCPQIGNSEAFWYQQHQPQRVLAEKTAMISKTFSGKHHIDEINMMTPVQLLKRGIVKTSDLLKRSRWNQNFTLISHSITTPFPQMLGRCVKRKWKQNVKIWFYFLEICCCHQILNEEIIFQKQQHFSVSTFNILFCAIYS